MNNPLISLIIPMHNAEKYIAECIDSVLKQTHRNIEIIIIDDCSTDSSADIVNRYVKAHPTVKYFKTNNKNAAKTRRDGVNYAKADLVCFLDADDILESEYVECLYRTMQETNTSISACEMETFSESPASTATHNKGLIHTIPSDADSFAGHYHISNTNKLVLQTLHCKLFKKELFEDIDYTVLVTNIFEDNFIMVQILRQVDEVGVIDKVLYWYRQTSNSTSSNTLKIKVEYEGRILNFVEFFKDVVMEYCRKTLKGQNVDTAIDRISVTEFYNYARLVPELKVRSEYLEQKLELRDQQLAAKNEELQAIHDSRSYKVSSMMTKSADKIVNTFKRRGK